MKKTCSLLASLFLFAGLTAWAQEPAPMALRIPGPERGKVLLLTNDRGLEGDVERMGGKFRIRRTVGELLISGEQAKRVCADWGEALAHMRSESNLADPDERIRLSRWCTTNGLRQEALEEAKAALELRPESKQLQQMVQMLQRAVENASTPQADPVAVTSAATTGTAPNVDIGAESYAVFVGKVQPILMNTCASCHAAGRGGEFRLFKPHEGGSKVSAMRNLAVVLSYVTPDRPTASPILAKSVSAHGTATNPPISGRKSAPFKTLESWVENTVATHPHLRSEPKTATAPPPSALPTTPVRPTNTQVVSRNVPRVDNLPTPTPNVPLDPKTPKELPASATNVATPLPVPAAEEPSDEFDPLIFNRTGAPKK